jgi:hypothetical protein
MKPLYFAVLVFLCSCANQSFRDQAAAYCSQPLKPGEIEDLAQTNSCIEAHERQLIAESNAYHLNNMASTFDKMNADAMARMPKTSNCVMIGNTASCTTR